MSFRILRLFRAKGFLLLAVLQVSCSQILINARQTTGSNQQANDRITGTFNLVGALFRATAVAAVRQPVTTVKVGVASLWNRPQAIVIGLLPIYPDADHQPEEVPGTWQFERLLDRNKMPAEEAGTLRFLVDGRSFFPELDRQIAAARSSIDVQVFIFDNDDIGVRYADSLKRRSREVAVNVLFDDFGSSTASSTAPKTSGPGGFVPPADMHVYLRGNSQVHARRALTPWLSCDHTKLMVFDHRTAILGGMNIGREYYSEWHDMMVRVDGPVVQTLARDFTRSWQKAGPAGDLAMLQRSAPLPKPNTPAAGFSMRVLRTDPAEGRYEILKAELLAIRAARKRIWIENSYFAHDEMVAALAAAARRGVDVRVIIPEKGDSVIMDAGNLSTANTLIRAGAKFLRYPKMTHMKAILCDNWACVGSANFDNLSMRINRELNLSFSDGKAVKKLEQAVFLPDFAKSRMMRLSETNSPTAAVAELVADQL